MTPARKHWRRPAAALAAALGAALTAALAATAALAPAAGAATSPRRAQATGNWAGYAVGGRAISFRKVSGSWVQPAVTCSASTPTYSAYWVGLGGYSTSSQALEQIGTEADCTRSGGASYDAWFELVPAAPVDLRLKVRPGDTYSASVTVRGHSVTLRLLDSSSGQTFSRTLQMRSPDVSSAEWIVEAPSACDNTGSCATLPLADFGTLAFTSAAARAGGHTGPISDPAWTATALALVPGHHRFGGGFARTFARSGRATPGSLSTPGSAFSVSWQQPANAQPQVPVPVQLPSGPPGVAEPQ